MPYTQRPGSEGMRSVQSPLRGLIPFGCAEPVQSKVLRTPHTQREGSDLGLRLS
jgi:hypothetical protein